MRSRPMAVVASTLIAVLGAPAPAGAEQRSILRIAIPADQGSLTPYTFHDGYPLMSLVYDTLEWRDAKGVPRPWLARSVRRDGLRVIVKLRRGLRWQDGRPLTAADVAFTFRHVATHRHPRFTLQVRDVRSVVAVDPRTVVFTLRRPSLGFADQPLADVPILPRHLWEGLAPGRLAPAGLPVGSGPYRLVRHDVGRRYRFRADPRYFRGAPSVRTLDVRIIPAEQAGIDALRQRRIDVAFAPLAPGQVPDRATGVRYADGASYAGTRLVFNVERAPFARLAARRAVAEALDLDKVTGGVLGPGATTAASRGALHPGSRWAPTAVLHRYDPQAARRAFSEQGIGRFRVLASSGDGVRMEAARRVVRALRLAGAQARLAIVSPRVLDRALGGHRRAPTFDAAVVGAPALASYDPDYLRTVFGDPATAALNDGGYRSARFERLADRVASATTVAARRRAVAEELRLLAADLPDVPLFFGGTAFAFRRSAYDRWVDVRGTGILDKRSFLGGSDRATPAGPAAAGSDEPGAPTADDSGGDAGISLVPFIIVLGVALVLGVAWWVRHENRHGRRPR